MPGEICGWSFLVTRAMYAFCSQGLLWFSCFASVLLLRPSSAEVACSPPHYLPMGFPLLGFDLLGRVQCCASHHPHSWMFLLRLLVLERGL